MVLILYCAPAYMRDTILHMVKQGVQFRLRVKSFKNVLNGGNILLVLYST